MANIEIDDYIDFHESTKIYKKVPFYTIFDNKNITKKYLYQKPIGLSNQFHPCKNLKRAVSMRTSKRNFIADRPTKFSVFSTLMYYSCYSNKKSSEGKRAYPSAGARYPLEIYPIIFNVESLIPGLYFYDQTRNYLVNIKKGDFRKRINKIIQNQNFPLECSFAVVITAFFDKTIEKYGVRGYRYVFLEAGHLSQNFYLLSSATDIGCVAIGGFYDQSLDRFIGSNENETSIYMLCLGEI